MEGSRGRDVQEEKHPLSYSVRNLFFKFLQHPSPLTAVDREISLRNEEAMGLSTACEKGTILFGSTRNKSAFLQT
ncbi:MAG: hypothetical protein DCC43_10900 [Candidatus Brocadia sp.]|nr:hypothetical protein [Candidatus Brocadia sp. AMX3]RIJ96801.1 MAG: hypothetical protein DCC43_10900 [Candidatus Brocadia sp.]